VGLVARVIEAAGIPTVCLNMIWPYQRVIGMPRVAAIEHPFGRPYGDVADNATQSAVLRAGLSVFEVAKQAGHIEHLPFRWHEDPKDTRWHPAEPSPIIALINERREKAKSKSKSP
jgi:D-proline reductase (dithiol) PrdB